MTKMSIKSYSIVGLVLISLVIPFIPLNFVDAAGRTTSTNQSVITPLPPTYVAVTAPVIPSKQINLDWGFSYNQFLRQKSSPIFFEFTGGVNQIKLGVINGNYFPNPTPTCLKDADIQASLMGWLTESPITVQNSTSTDSSGIVYNNFTWDGRKIYDRYYLQETYINAVDPYWNFERNFTRIIALSQDANGQWVDQSGCYTNWDITDQARLIHRDQVVINQPSKSTSTVPVYHIGDNMNISWDGGYYGVIPELTRNWFVRDSSACWTGDTSWYVGRTSSGSPWSQYTWGVDQIYTGPQGWQNVLPGRYKMAVASYVDLYYDGTFGYLSDANQCDYNWDISAEIEITSSVSKQEVNKWLASQIKGNTNNKLGSINTPRTSQVPSKPNGKYISFKQSLRELPYRNLSGRNNQIVLPSNPSQPQQPMSNNSNNVGLSSNQSVVNLQANISSVIGGYKIEKMPITDFKYQNTQVNQKNKTIESPAVNNGYKIWKVR